MNSMDKFKQELLELMGKHDISVDCDDEYDCDDNYCGSSWYFRDPDKPFSGGFSLADIDGLS